MNTIQLAEMVVKVTVCSYNNTGSIQKICVDVCMTMHH